MHHFPVSKGDSLCPLGFHPQVRWPTRCKRCFRDYKEHYNKKKEEESLTKRDAITSSNPSLSNKTRNDVPRSWVSSDNLYDGKLENELTEYKSTYDLVHLEDNSPITTVNLRLPKRRSYEDKKSVSFDSTFDRKENSIFEKSSGDKDDKEQNRIQIKEVKSISNGPTNNDVQFFIQVKKKPENTQTKDISNENVSNNNNDSSHLEKKLNEFQKKLEKTEEKCKELENHKRDVILRRLPTIGNSNKSNSEFNHLQQKYNDLQKTLDEFKDEKQNLQLKVKILEDELRVFPKEKSNNSTEKMKSKLKSVETMCGQLKDENELLKKEIREMEEQLDEMQDNFREDQVAEYTSLKTELEQTIKNCRILSFKLRKAEKRNDQFEYEKREMEKQLKEISENQMNSHTIEKIKRLEQELADSTNESTKLQTELGLLNKKLSELESSSNETKVKKTGNTEVKKISRQSLIRSGSQDEPVSQVQITETSEIERDLREQLKFSEEEVKNLRKTLTRIEGDNEILLAELKKLATRVRNKSGREKDVKNEDLRLQMEITEQEVFLLGDKNSVEPVNKSKLTNSTKISENKTNAKLIEYEKQIQELKENIEKEKVRNKQKQTELTKLKNKHEEELKKQSEKLETANKTFNETIKSNESSITELEKEITKGRATLKIREGEIQKLSNELEDKKTELDKIQDQLNALREIVNETNDKLKQVTTEKEKTEKDYKLKTKKLEKDLKAERAKLNTLKEDIEGREKQIKTLELELSKKGSDVEEKLQSKIEELSQINKKISEDYKEASIKLQELSSQKKDIENITKIKTEMQAERENLNSELQTIKQRMNNMISEKNELEEKFEKERSKWLTEKIKFQEEARKHSHNGNNQTSSDKKRFDSLIAEKQSELNMLKKETEALTNQIDYMKKENSEIRKKLDDYEKVNRVQRNISADTFAFEKEISDLKKRLETVEKTRKAENLKCKISYEEQMSSLNNEIKLLQSQTIRTKKEKDTYKNMLQLMQKNMGDLKFKKEMAEKYENGGVHTENLESQLKTLEDELSETKIEYSKLKSQLVSDKSDYEVKLLEMQIKINELEEEKILNSGRTKIAGLKTCMELSWQKEREEQQRLLQETATLARDLRQTLFEVEKERDKERLESKRKLEYLKKTVQEEQTESVKKMKDLQCDLLELRDAHAKLRTTNERLKREIDRINRNEDNRTKSLSRSSLNICKGESDILQHIETLKCLSDEVGYITGKEKTQSVSPEDGKEKLDNIVSSLLKISQNLFTQMKEIESEKIIIPRRKMRSETPTDSTSRLSRQSSLKKRSLSLEQTGPLSKEQNFWQTDQRSTSSLRSANSYSDLYDNMSDISVQSDVEKKEKKGIIGKIKKLGKSKSVEGNSGIFSSLLSGKKPSSLENLVGMFRKGGSSSRSNSMERTKSSDQKLDTSSRQRPLMKMKTESPAR